MLNSQTIEHLKREKHFLMGLNLEFPNDFISSPYLNDIFKAGLSIHQFESKYLLQCKSKQASAFPSMKECYLLVLNKDIWGPTKVMGICKESTIPDGPDCVITLAIRDEHEFRRLEHFCANNNKFRLMEDNPGKRTYEIMIDRWEYGDCREIVFFIISPNEQETRLSLSLKF